MVTNLVTFKVNDSVYDALQHMLEYKFSGAPVVNANKQLVGMFSESDCLKAILKMTYHEEEVNLLVGDFMCTRVDTVHESTGLVDVANLFIREGRRRLPVVNDEGQLVGQLSRRDVLKAVQVFHTRAQAS